MFDSHFFQMGPTPSNAISGHYIISLIILSYIMAFLASYVALEIAATLRQEKTKSDIWLLFSGAFAMGAGIFTMHFIGMLAFVMPMKMEYDLGETLLSLLVAIVASGFAFLIIRKQEVGYTRLILGGTILGIAIVSMHYIGMTSMQHISISYLPSLFFLSITIAIAASIMALWAMLECEKRKESSYQWLLKLGSALAMGFAISGMHYTGMEAAIFTPMTMPSQESFIFLLSPKKLAIFIAYLASSIIVITLLFNSYRHLILFKLLSSIRLYFSKCLSRHLPVYYQC
jgi:NO-binding membrane sensor protein with MHYT domain